jgi:hypothetical protein
VLHGVDFLCPKVRIPCVDDTVRGKVSLIREQTVRQFVVVVVAVLKTVHGWRDFPVEGFALLEVIRVGTIMV